ncbi:fimbrial biogenesis usher protein [Klebsiella pasteurii]|uniref:fimbrial biogenesis usher protein n=2 Tax=Klebsiella/Raoultella group TaxID=2890311 RepID=UPI00115BC30C|nr:fimbrial biogenesis usher protein [Klebsiella michiganensis]VUS50619.1 Outer membrane usher protein FimD [Klebsiella pasteurii]
MIHLKSLQANLIHIENRMEKSRCVNGVLIPSLLLVLLTISFPTKSELWFNPRFVSDDPTAVADLSSFENGQEVPEGVYRVDVYVNDIFLATKDIEFKLNTEAKTLYPCLVSSQLVQMNINRSSILDIDKYLENDCVPFTQKIQGATFKFDVGQQKLYLTFPQSVMNDKARDFIAPELWDDGINAGFINYNYTGNNVKTGNNANNNYAYLNLQSGVNIGVWRLRDNSTWSNSSAINSNNNKKFQHVNTWLERDIKILRSRLKLGDSFTNGDIFDGVNFQGIQITSDENMLPESQKGFAPVVHGIAKTTAQVSIKQNGYEIYRNTVPPGPFAIADLYAAGNGGDLLVTIKESDGSSQAFSVPYSSVPVLQREGHVRYSVTSGRYRSGSSQQQKPGFIQTTMLMGLSNGWTVYGGAQLANRFRSLNLGLGKNLGILGALSIDTTQANSILPDDSEHNGQSLRFLYNKSLSETGTNIQIVGYRYSTRGYFNFADTTYSKMKGYDVKTQDGVIHVEPKFTDYYNLAFKKRGKLQLSITQQIGNISTFYISGSHQSYWNTNKADEQLQTGFNTAFGDINWTLSYSLNNNAWQQGKDQVIATNINIPFSHWTQSNSKSIWKNGNASYSLTNDHNGRLSNLAGLYGTLLDDNNLSYSMQTGYTSGGDVKGGYSGYTALNYRGGYGNVNLGYSHNDGMRQVYYGMSGGILAHANGITFGQPMNDTFVLVKAPGASNVKVENQTGVQTDWRGYAVLPFASSYRQNRVALDTNSLPNNVDLDDSVVNMVPTHGAIIRADFKTKIGLKLLMTLTYMDKPVPFGAIVTLGSKTTGSIVADNGQVYMSGMPKSGEVTVKWGDSTNSSCIAEYSLPDESLEKLLNQISVVCR